MTDKKMYRQGDLLVIETKELPSSAIKTHGLNILGSSVTGHTHKINKEVNEVYINEPTWRNKGNFYLVLTEDDTLVHEEHGTIKLPAGIYEVRRQREVNGYVAD